MPVDGGTLELAASQGKGGHSRNSRSGELETAQQALKCGEPLYIASGREAPHPTGACIALPLQLVPEVLGVLTLDIAGHGRRRTRTRAFSRPGPLNSRRTPSSWSSSGRTLTPS